MAKLPVISGLDAVRAFAHLGYVLDHQTGSHMALRRADPPHRRLTVPRHRELSKGLLRALIREAGLTVEQFVELLNS